MNDQGESNARATFNEMHEEDEKPMPWWYGAAVVAAIMLIAGVFALLMEAKK